MAGYAKGPAEEAKDHMARAEQALKPSWMSLKFSPDHTIASMEYSQAASLFRSAGMLQEAVNAWTKTAETKELLHDQFGAGRAYESAGAICDGTGPGGPEAAVGHWEKAIRCFRLAGKGEIAAKLILKMAALREKQKDVAGAKAAYQDAIEVFEQDEKDYDLADVYKSYTGFLVRAECFEDAMKAMDGHMKVLLRQKNVVNAHKEVLAKVVLLLKLEDTVRAQQAMSAAGDVPGWFTSKECQVGSDLIEGFRACDPEAVATAIKDQTFTFLQVEVARIAKQLKVVAVAAPGAGQSGGVADQEAHLADALM